MIEFSSEQKELITNELRRFVNEELGQDVGTFEAMDLFDFVSESIGPMFYNRGLLDAQAVLSKRIDAVTEAISELEKSSKLER